MTFSVSNIASSLAKYLTDLMPGVTFYEDPRQQKTKCPCEFLQLISSEILLRRQKYLLRTLRFDLTHLEDYNLPDLQKRYEAVQEILDLNMELFPISDGEDSALMRTYNRIAQIDLDALHYKFELRVWLSPHEDGVLMKTYSTDIDIEVANGQ